MIFPSNKNARMVRTNGPVLIIPFLFDFFLLLTFSLSVDLLSRVTCYDCYFRHFVSLAFSQKDCPDGLVSAEILRDIYTRFFPCGSKYYSIKGDQSFFFRLSHSLHN